MQNSNKSVQKVFISSHAPPKTMEELHSLWKSRKILLRKLNSPLLKIAKKATRAIEKTAL
ncbi:hypothetical protein NEMIN01_1333 [Nematocida minor]|uniref:uncharacterized protein n=1 Tax=Nematocida minor TaxID=1912983 RepID=UPI00221F3DD1|nr:uncharacterized protein NEMIN01_1333 [Nematocida minor]KAI5191064.1 hypothetical protein NEMIN01_1333 [Nematocida minor]